jgi:DNA-binding NtrC family response regulator
VRELRNAIEYAAALCRKELIDEQLLDLKPAPEVMGAPANAQRAPAALPPAAAPPAAAHGSLRQQLKRYERACIAEALERCDGNQTLAARELCISRRALVNKLTEHALERPRKQLLRLLTSTPNPPGVA